MLNSHRYHKRNRGLSLSDEGLKKLKEARIKYEFYHNSGKRLTLEEISHLTTLDMLTIRKVLNNDTRVDKRTLEYLFSGFGITLELCDYATKSDNLREDWGGLINYSNFYGRHRDILILENYLLKDSCKLLAILGLGGVGKTSLCFNLVKKVKDKFDCVIWRCLKTKPSISRLLDDWLKFLYDKEYKVSYLHLVIEDKINLLLESLKRQKVLLIIDSIDSLFYPGKCCGYYIDEYNEYTKLFHILATFEHQSCLIVIGRERPKDITLMSLLNLPVKLYEVKGLDKLDSQKIIESKELEGSEENLDSLIKLYSGHPLALEFASSAIIDLFNGSIKKFLDYNVIVFGEIYSLLDAHFEKLSYIEKKLIYSIMFSDSRASLFEIDKYFSERYHNSNLCPSRFSILEGIDSLLRRFLVIENNGYFQLLPLLEDYALNRLNIENTDIGSLTRK